MYKRQAYTYSNLAPGYTIGSAKGNGRPESRLGEYFNTAAFQLPVAYSTDFGNLRNVLVGPPQKLSLIHISSIGATTM